MTGSRDCVALTDYPATGQVADQGVRNVFLIQDTPRRRHDLAEFRIPRRRLRRPGQPDMLRVRPHSGEVVRGTQTCTSTSRIVGGSVMSWCKVT